MAHANVADHRHNRDGFVLVVARCPRTHCPREEDRSPRSNTRSPSPTLSSSARCPACSPPPSSTATKSPPSPTATSTSPRWSTPSAPPNTPSPLRPSSTGKASIGRQFAQALINRAEAGRQSPRPARLAWHEKDGPPIRQIHGKRRGRSGTLSPAAVVQHPSDQQPDTPQTPHHGRDRRIHRRGRHRR